MKITYPKKPKCVFRPFFILVETADEAIQLCKALRYATVNLPFLHSGAAKKAANMIGLEIDAQNHD